MKKIIAMLLALAMVLSLAACGAEKEPPKGTITTTQEPEKTPETQETDSEAAEQKTQDTEASQDFSLGAMQGGTYENAYVGYGCKLDANWTYKTAEELQDISGMTKEMFEGTDLDLSAYNQITDMMAECSDPLASINIQYTSLSTQDRIAHAMAGEEGIIDATLQQKDLLVSTYAQAGIEVTSMEKVKITFCGEERFAIKTVASIQGMGYYILQLFDTNIGPYYVTLTMGTFVDDNTDALVDLFYSLK